MRSVPGGLNKTLFMAETMFKTSIRSVLSAVALIGIWYGDALAQHPPPQRIAPPTDERQLPFAMHSEMKQLPSITVGRTDADLIGSDNRALQAAVDYIAALGGGTVEIGPGEYHMQDSLHLRSHVTVRGQEGTTILRKADGVVSMLALDGDFGEQQITVEDATGFDVGHGVAIWDDRAGGFHTTVARITGRTGNTFSIDKPLMSDCMVRNKRKQPRSFRWSAATSCAVFVCRT